MEEEEEDDVEEEEQQEQDEEDKSSQQNSESSTVPVGGCFVWFNAPDQLAQLQRNTSETTVGKWEDEE